MTVEQTSQLIQLILNSTLMVAVCGLVLMGLLVRQGTLQQQLHWINREYREQLMGTAILQGDRFQQLKSQQQELRRHYRQIHASILIAYSALLLLLISSLMLALRSLWNQDWLIPASMVMFAVGNGVMVLSVGMALVEIRSASNSLLGELRDWVQWRDPEGIRPRLTLPRRRSRRVSEKRVNVG
ncbi:MULTISPECIES: DUF2721 domain-containing protein [unclassified Leptolyngbya]|uniref:DUF2721 domain-containing protein n=1 Tax=unclassified Leptolyngbya TaxID=2650499 RepID=UPI0016829495|nr:MULTISPECIES: DUF2721 domain-containing protein [unclassified Leptolyngbya]MBD1911492.1 DUF2721 domain-containing protein [Leptolyngbya sp. FACHB-8]MBD2155268.1 DUF2721 domain-containing protein [Leptolyngbya sp. FACHB-16]